MRTSEACGRLAPSPTGQLHLGHARTFLIAWLAARSRGRQLVLRHEDLDSARVQPSAYAAVEEDLEWLGLDWDRTCRQSARVGPIRTAAQSLVAKGLAYPCVCSRGEIRDAIGAPHGLPNDYYPGTCRGRFASLDEAEQETGKLAGIRFSTPSGSWYFVDGVVGAQHGVHPPQGGDFLIVRRDKVPAYQLSVVVDDAHDGVREVVRGGDLLDSTPRQLLLYEALGSAAPAFFHVGLVCDAQGQRLAKRYDALALRALRDQGVKSHQLVSWVAATLGLSPKLQRTGELLDAFEWALVDGRPVAAPSREAFAGRFASKTGA